MSYTDEFIQAYIECALWSSNNDRIDPEGHGCPLDEDHGPEDLTANARATVLDDCLEFIEANAADLEYCLASEAGRDFWLTRNGHGAGFWDRWHGDNAAELRAVCERLSDAAKARGESYMESTGDGQVEVF